jgi:hypothetical protein
MFSGEEERRSPHSKVGGDATGIQNQRRGNMPGERVAGRRESAGRRQFHGSQSVQEGACETGVSGTVLETLRQGMNRAEAEAVTGLNIVPAVLGAVMSVRQQPGQKKQRPDQHQTDRLSITPSPVSRLQSHLPPHPREKNFHHTVDSFSHSGWHFGKGVSG